MNWLRDLPINTKTDRDVEIPLLMEFVNKHQPQSLLDVGAHWSHAYYAPQVREVVKRYHAIDILEDEQTAAIVDKYIVGNANTHEWDAFYEMVICVSTLEHAGLSTYKGDPTLEKIKLFETVTAQSGKYAWVSFPIGVGEIVENQLETISFISLAGFIGIAQEAGFSVKTRFFYSQGPQAGHPWREHDDVHFARKIPYIDFIGNQSICVLEMEKNEV